MKIKINYYDNDYQEMTTLTLNNLKPRRYMTSWTWEQLIDYMQEELYFNGIEPNSIDEIIIFSKSEQWQEVIAR